MIILILHHCMTYLPLFNAMFTTRLCVCNFFVQFQNSNVFQWFSENYNFNLNFEKLSLLFLNNLSTIIWLEGVLSLFLQLQHGILKSLSGTAFVWLLQMLQAFYAGSMSQFESVMAEQKGRQVWIIFNIMKVWFILND